MTANRKKDRKKMSKGVTKKDKEINLLAEREGVEARGWGTADYNAE